MSSLAVREVLSIETLRFLREGLSGCSKEVRDSDRLDRRNLPDLKFSCACPDSSFVFGCCFRFSIFPFELFLLNSPLASRLCFCFRIEFGLSTFVSRDERRASQLDTLSLPQRLTLERLATAEVGARVVALRLRLFSNWFALPSTRLSESSFSCLILECSSSRSLDLSCLYLALSSSRRDE